MLKSQSLESLSVALSAEDKIDTDGSGVIDYSEFMAATMDKKKFIQD